MNAQLSAARRHEVLQWVQIHGAVQVRELAASLGVSASTIRRDLSQMEDEGLLRRVHGGAMVEAAGGEVEPQLQERAVAHAAQKRQIAASAARMVSDGSTILISGGTTTEAMVPLLTGHTQLTVVTNALPVAMALSDAPGVDVVVLGGYLRRGELSLLGQLTRRALDDLIVDSMFAGAFGLDGEGVTGANVAEAETDRHLMSAVRHLVILADSSKFGHRGPVRLARTDQIGALVTDRDADPADLTAWRASGVEVIVA